MLTPWFKPTTQPVRDGLYVVRRVDGECWHVCRWNGATATWYSAGTAGTEQMDVIGWERLNYQDFEWRGLVEQPA